MPGFLKGALMGALLFRVAAAAADGISVNPVRVELQPGQKAASLTVTNQSSEPRVVQASVAAWGPGENALAPAADALVAPALFRIPPGGKQLVRIGMTGPPPDPAVEHTYRIVLEEVPSGGATPNQIRVMLRFSIPVFVRPAQARDALQWSLQRGADGKAVVALDNRGNRHVRVDGMTLTPETGPPAGHREMTYVLAGGHREWATDLAPAAGSRVRLHADSDLGKLDAELSAPN